MTYIKKISMTGFKSFGDRTVTIKLSSGFTCVVGPNGAGKSNIIDALCFALGRLSKKTMRAKNLEDLIFAGSKGKNPSNRASVTIYFDNSEGLFPGSKDNDFTITRTIKRGGGGGYKMNEEKVPRQQILNALAAANVDPDGSNQFVLQGRIVELTHMNPEDRRKFIEELIGLQKYDEMKDATLKELEKAERDLGQFEAIFKEVSSQLKKVEKEKNDALAWKEFEEKISFYNAQLIALKINKLQIEEKDLEKRIDVSIKILEELQEKITKQEDLLKQESLVMDNIQKTITEKEKEREEINEKITELKAELSSTQTSLSLAKKSIDKLNQEKQQLENLLMKLEEGQSFDALIKVASNEIIEIDKQIESNKQEIELKQQQQAEIDTKIQDHEGKSSEFKFEISKLKQNISSQNSKIKILKENIKKNESKKEKLETELKSLKGDYESIEEAREAILKKENEIRSVVEDLKLKISNENQKQRNLESDINSIQSKKNETNAKLSDLKANQSSFTTEINLNKSSIEEYNQKISVLEKKIQDLSKGKEAEVIVRDLLTQKEKIIENINNLKKKSKEEDSSYRKNEQELELLKLKLNSIDSEINDNKTKISNINTELKIFEKELTSLDREKNSLSINIKTLNSSSLKLSNEIQNLNSKKENVQRRLDELSKEKEALIKKIESSEKEYDKNKDDITGILQILNMLTQNINVSVESIKSNIQQSNSEAIEVSAEDFKKFVLDVVDIMKTMKSVSCKNDEMSNMLNSILQTLSLFIDNAEYTLSQIVDRVKESADIAVQESTSNFDSFVMDLMEILENIHISLRKLTMSKSQELYKQLEDLSTSIKGQENDTNDIEKKLTELNVKNFHDSENLKKLASRNEEIQKRISELNEKINTYKKENDDRNKVIQEKTIEKETLYKEFTLLNNFKQSYWEKISKIQEDIDNTQLELDKNQEKMKDLQGIQTIYENIADFKDSIHNVNEVIEKKEDQLKNVQNEIHKVNTQQQILDQEIEKLNTNKDKFWGVVEDLQQQIDQKNKELEEIVDKLRSLDNVIRIINSIDELTKENIDADKNIELSNKNVEELNKQVVDVQKSIDEIQSIIDTLKDEKNKELSKQKEAQQNLNNLNKELQKKQAHLNEINKNKEREQKIFAFTEEINKTQKDVESFVLDIQKIEENLLKETKLKEDKQLQIDTYLKDKDDSWSKQKSYQKNLTDLKSDLSIENSKKSNFESKKIICHEQIDTLYERSKDYGTLPSITDELSEEGLQSDISIVTQKKKALEPVNLKAIEQYDTVKERFDEIDMRRATIQRERKSILDAIEKIDLEKTKTFMTAYQEISRTFSQIFQKLSPGGSARLLLDRPDSPFEGGVSIEARPRGKKISSIEILSGGEKTLVALAFIFAIQEFYPAPFYVMDEIDAALDGPNVHRVSMVVKDFSKNAQFIVISHREENIVNSDRIYGVSMQQSGITDIFSVDLEQEAKRLLEIEGADTEVEDN